MTAIAIASASGQCLPVLLKSIECYVPNDVDVYISSAFDVQMPDRRVVCMPNTATNFGDAYNKVVKAAFMEHDLLVVSNDDVVLTPTSYDKLMADYRLLSEQHKVGWVAAKCDYARPAQNIRSYKQLNGPRFQEEDWIYECQVVAPIFGVISRAAWQDYDPINWFSDDVQCYELGKQGYKHFVSRSYVHHVGSQTVGEDFTKCRQEAEPWLKANRPEYHKLWY